MIPLRIFWRATPPWVKAALAGALLVAAVAFGSYQAGKRAEATARDLQNALDYKEGIEDAQDATNGLPDTDSGLADWLRRIGQ